MKRVFALLGMVAAGLVPTPAQAKSLDLLDQQIELDLSQSDISIDLRLTARAQVQTHEIVLPTMTVAMSDLRVNGTLATTKPHPDYPDYMFVVTLPSTLAPGDEVTVTAHAQGTLSCAAVNGYQPCERTPTRTLLLPYSFSNHCWYWFNVEEPDGFTSTVRVRVPESFDVVMPQGPSTAQLDLGDGTMSWEFQLDEPAELLGVYAGSLAKVSVNEPFAVTAYYDAENVPLDRIQHAVELAGQVLSYYESIFVPLPIESAALVTFNSAFAVGGLGMFGDVFLMEAAFSDRGLYLLEQGVAHEFAHSYWGGLADSPLVAESGFINEGLAEYSAWRALGHLQSEAVRTAGMRMHATWYMYGRPGNSDVAILDSGAPEVDPMMYTIVNYSKGPLVWRALAEAVGEEKFTAVLRRFVSRGFGGLSLAAMLEDAQAETGVDLSARLAQWTERTGYPRLLVSTRIPAGPTAEVRMRITNNDNFAVELPLRFRMPDGTVVEDRLPLKGGANDKVWTLAAKPVAVEVDPRWTMVREVTGVPAADVTLDGSVDAADLIEVALHKGCALPNARRKDGHYDPLYDINRDRVVDDVDMSAVVQ